MKVKGPWPLTKLAAAYNFRIIDYQSRGKILFLETNKGRYAIKSTGLEPEELDLQYAVCSHILQKGYDKIAAIIPAENGRGFAQIGSKRFIASGWIEGKQLNFLSPPELELAIRNLARFHSAAQGYFGQVYWQKRRIYGVWPQRFSYRFGYVRYYRRNICARGIQSEFDKLFMDNVDNVLAQADRAIERLRCENYYRSAGQARKLGTICHHDYAYHNILLGKDLSPWLIDFDYCILDSPLHDLGSLLLRVAKLTNWSLEEAARILLIYHEEKPLQPSDLELLYSFMEYPEDFWQVAWAFYNEIGMHRPENLVYRLRRFIESYDARNKFLNGFSQLKL